MTYGTLV
jgi:hypothetical protein